jgi:hypothetical protein
VTLNGSLEEIWSGSLGEIRCEVVDCTKLSLDRIPWGDFVKTAINI